MSTYHQYQTVGLSVSARHHITARLLNQRANLTYELTRPHLLDWEREVIEKELRRTLKQLTELGWTAPKG